MIIPSKLRTLKKQSVEISELSAGSVQIGNLFRALTNETANDLIDHAWECGVRYFDTAPYYGHGLAEHRLGHYFHSKNREDFVISTKVGRTLVPSPKGTFSHGDWVDVPPMKVEFDYSYDGVMRQLESSLQRLLMDRVDILLLHDADHYTHGKDQPKRFAEAIAGAVPAMLKLRDQKVVRAIGAGFNNVDCLIDLINQADVDCLLVAGRYTLLEQEGAKELMDLALERGVSLILGSIFNSGILATGPKPNSRYHYEQAKPDKLELATKINNVCEKYGVSLPAAAIAFAGAHPAVVSVCIGSSSIKQQAANYEYGREEIPSEFWSELRDRSLIAEWAPTPG